MAAFCGSPLKRSFTAAVEDGYGLKYLKRRRMSGEKGFGPVEPRVQRARRDDDAAVSRARSVPEPMVVRTGLGRIHWTCWLTSTAQ